MENKRCDFCGYESGKLTRLSLMSFIDKKIFSYKHILVELCQSCKNRSIKKLQKFLLVLKKECKDKHL